MDDTYKLLDLNPADTTTLEQYLQVLSVSRGYPVGVGMIVGINCQVW